MAEDGARVNTDEVTYDYRPYIDKPMKSYPVEYNQRDLLLYAVGIGCSDLRYTLERHPQFAAFPTYPLCLGFKGHSYDVLEFLPPVGKFFDIPPAPGLITRLDAERYIEKVAELPKTGAKLTLRGKPTCAMQKGKGALLEGVSELVDDSGKLYYKMISAGFHLGSKDFIGGGQPTMPAVEQPTGEPSRVAEVTTDAHIANIYRLSGDYNKLHVDPEVAMKAGFEKPILHGLCTLGYTVRVVLDEVAGGDQARFKSVQMRFASPVLPGDALKVEMWIVSPTEVAFRTLVKETGKVCISHGLMRLNPEAKL